MPKGGFRPGSGRKSKPDENKVVKTSVSLPFEMIEFLKTKGNASKYIAELIRAEMEKKE